MSKTNDLKISKESKCPNCGAKNYAYLIGFNSKELPIIQCLNCRFHALSFNFQGEWIN